MTTCISEQALPENFDELVSNVAERVRTLIGEEKALGTWDWHLSLRTGLLNTSCHREQFCAPALALRQNIAIWDLRGQYDWEGPGVETDDLETFEITNRDTKIGGGWNVKIISNGELVAGAVFPITAEMPTEQAAHQEALDWAKEYLHW